MYLFNYLIPSFIIASVLMSTTALAQAPEPTSATTTTPNLDRPTSTPRERLETRMASSSERMEERQASSTLRQENRTELRNERQAALNELRQKRVLNLSANISNRMEAAISRLYNIVARLETRIATLKNNGVETSAAEAKLREAASYLSEAKALISNIDSLVNEATTSTEPQKRWANVRTTYQNTGSKIRSAHQALRETVALLKEAVIKAEGNASSAVNQNEATTTTTNQ